VAAWKAEFREPMREQIMADRISELLLHRRRNLTLEAMRQQAVQTAWAEAALSSGSNRPSSPAASDPNDRNDTP